MNKYMWTAALSAVIVFLTAGMKQNTLNQPDADGHVLTALWAQYTAATKADRPQKEAEILADIKAEAQRQHLAVDFYDAAVQYVYTVQRRDWKQRGALREQLSADVAAFGEPVVTYLWMGEFAGKSTDERWAYVQDHADAFRGVHRPFYRTGKMGGALKDFIADDKEYVLWDLLGDRHYTSLDDDEIYQTLKAHLGDRYPDAAWLEYYRAVRLDEKEQPAALEALAARYAGRGLAFWPRQDLLQAEFAALEKDKASSEAFQAFYEKCRRFEKERAALQGDEARVAQGCTLAKSLMETLTASSLLVRMEQGNAAVLLRNLDKAEVTLRKADGKDVLRTWTAVDPVRSFYVIDTVRIALPELPDGAYLVEAVNGKRSASATYTQYRLSLAARQDARGQAAYVADHLTGRPLERATLVLWKGDTRVLSETVTLDGFTVLPKKFQQAVAASPRVYYALSAETGSGTELRSSERLSLYHTTVDAESAADGRYCNLYKDRGAYNPGDTLRFKAVLYKGDLVEKVAVMPDTPVQVVLTDAEGKEVDRLSLKTNAFGSASGSFVLPVGKRNGYFSLRVVSGKVDLAYDSFRVDEFVLPTFTLSFDTRDELYLPGDQVPVSGRVTSYTGHSLTGATLTAQVERYGTVVHETTLTPAQDGAFSLSFPAEESGYYTVTVQVSDATGETLSFDTALFISDAIRVALDVRDAADGEFVTLDERNVWRPVFYRRNWRPSPSQYIVTGDTLQAEMRVDDSNGNRVDVPLGWRLLAEDGSVLRQGKAASGEVVSIDLSGIPSGLFTLKASAAVKETQDESECKVLKVKPSDTVLDAPLRRVFIAGKTEVEDGGKIRLQVGTADGAEWALVTLYGRSREVLLTRKLNLEGVRGKAGSLATVELDYRTSYPDAVRLQVFYFKRGQAVSFERQYTRVRTRLSLPLTFSRFTDKAYPGSAYTFSVRTDPGVEALAAVYDKSIDAVAGNAWPVVTLRDFSVPSVTVNSVCGRVSGQDTYAEEDALIDDDSVVMAYGVSRAMTKSAASVNMMAMEDAVAEEAAPEMAAGMEVPVRSKFENALTFQPHLVSDASGALSFSFRTSDKLSTYYVALYAHDKAMRNAYLRQEMVVSIPVKVAVVEPRYLYEGDTYELAASVSSIADVPVSGQLYLYVYPSADYEGQEPVAVQRVAVSVPAGGVVSHRFPVQVPSGYASGPDAALGFRVAFVADDFSDALFLPVPVYPAVQTLTEAHSAVLRSGMDRETLLDELRGRFVNVPGTEARLREISLLDLVRDAIPSKVEPAAADVLSLSEAWYVRLLAGKCGASSVPSGTDGDDALLARILACRNADGGFGWFEGMTSSPVITAVLLERFAKLRARGFEVPDLATSVQYLDRRQFTTELPLWCGWVSDAQYMYVRSLYPCVKFDVKPSAQAEKRRMAAFRKAAKDYLVPSAKEGRGLQGQILAKARRIKTLLQLSASSDGIALAKAWGVTVAAKSKMEKSLRADVTSLLEYAVEHRDGGWYYPDAVMPWRGLLESEAYAHALLCDLLCDPAASGGQDIADGIRLWLMLQKETQQWDADPAFVDALTSVLDGSPDVLSTRILALDATYSHPFDGIQAVGNGFTIERRFFREVTVEKVYDDRTSGKNDQVTELQEILPGTPIHAGEKIIAQYRIWNQENRSFVKVDAFREATLRPVDQLSGYSGWGTVRPLRHGTLFTFAPQGYRNVKADRTEYYFDIFPEENTTLTEAFFVTQAGTFTAPVVTIESLYAPHYRANAPYTAPLPVTP